MARPRKTTDNTLYIFNLRLTRPMYQKLRALSRTDSLSQQEHIRRALDLYFDDVTIDLEKLQEVVQEDRLKFEPPVVKRSRSLPKRPAA